MRRAGNRECLKSDLAVVVERFEQCAGVGGVAGPSTAPVAKCATGFAQDDKFVG